MAKKCPMISWQVLWMRVSPSSIANVVAGRSQTFPDLCDRLNFFGPLGTV
jgi:hypothetical protein